MEGLVILIIWAMINAFIKGANNKNNEGKTKTTTNQQKRKNIFSTFLEELEKEMQGEKEKQRLEQPAQWAQPPQLSKKVQPKQPIRPAQPTMVSGLPPRPQPSMLSDSPKPKAAPKPVGLEIDYIGGDEEIGGINEAGIFRGSKNNLNLDIKRDLIKGIIYSEILSKPKSLRN